MIIREGEVTTIRCDAERRDLPGRTDNVWMNPEQGNRISDQLTRDKVGNAQTKLIILPELTLAHRLSSSAQSIITIMLLQNGLRKCSGRATDGSSKPASFWTGRTSPDMDKAHAHGACSQMRHGMCVRRQLIWRRPELGPRPADRCPCSRGETASSRPVGRAENFRAQRDGCQ